jgi:hypothetical protein
MNRKRGINDLGCKKIVLQRGFRHLGVLALNWNDTIITGRSPDNPEIPGAGAETAANRHQLCPHPVPCQNTPNPQPMRTPRDDPDRISRNRPREPPPRLRR